MLYNLANETDRADFKKYCNDLYLWGKTNGGIVEVKKKHKPRSIPQNSYLHFCLSYFASEFGNTLDEVKYDIFKKLVNKQIFARVRKNRRGEEVTYYRSTSDLDRKEMTDAIERFRNYSVSYCSLYIPAPHEEEALIEAQKQIALFERYL